MTNHKTWFDATVHGATKLEVATKTGIANSTLAHQYRLNQLSATTVIAVAKAYGYNVVEALVDTDFLTPEDAQLPESPSLASLSDQDLIRELARRIDDTPSHWDGTFEDVFERNNVHTLEFVEQEPISQYVVHEDDYDDRLLASAHELNPDSGKYEEIMPPDAVADDSEEVGGTLDDLDP